MECEMVGVEEENKNNIEREKEEKGAERGERNETKKKTNSVPHNHFFPNLNGSLLPSVTSNT